MLDGGGDGLYSFAHGAVVETRGTLAGGGFEAHARQGEISAHAIVQGGGDLPAFAFFGLVEIGGERLDAFALFGDRILSDFLMSDCLLELGAELLQRGGAAGGALAKAKAVTLESGCAASDGNRCVKEACSDEGRNEKKHPIEERNRRDQPDARG